MRAVASRLVHVLRCTRVRGAESRDPGRSDRVKLATIRDGIRTLAVRIDGDQAVELGASDVGEVLRQDNWRTEAAEADGLRRPVDGLDFAPVVPGPASI